MSPLISNLIEQQGYPLLTQGTADAFLQAHENVVLFFTENPLHFPESNDVAVILPELMKAFAGRLVAAVIDQASERALHQRYGFNGWPSLVFLRRGDYLGAITRVQDWNVYLQEIERLLGSEPTRPPAFKVPVVGESAGRTGH